MGNLCREAVGGLLQGAASLRGCQRRGRKTGRRGPALPGLQDFGVRASGV